MIVLPTDPAPNGAEPFFIDYGGFLTPGLGGEVQRLDRMGNRFGLSVSMPPLESEDEGRIFVSRLIRAKSEGLRMEFPLLSFDPGSPGSPVVNGAGQAGRTLAARGFTPHYTVREGQWFSLFSGGCHYLHNIDAEVVANAAGQVALPISPMLRVEPADGDTLHFAQPMIEGYVQGDELRWQMSLAHHLGLEFEIRERR